MFIFSYFQLYQLTGVQSFAGFATNHLRFGVAEWDGEEDEDGEEDDHKEHSKDQEHPPSTEKKIIRLNQSCSIFKYAFNAVLFILCFLNQL